MAFWNNIKPITRNLSDEAMPIGDMSAKDTVRNDIVRRLRPAASNPNINGANKDTTLANGLRDLLDGDPQTEPTPSDSGSSAKVAVNDVDYLNADLAKHYGMSAQTAYAEAMSNTAYQRAVKDMQAAGLNPALLAQGSYAQPAGSGYVSGSSGGRSYGSSAKSSLDNSGMWQGLASMAVAAGVFLATKSKAGAAAAAVAAKSLATVAGQSAKAMAKR